MKTFQHLFAQVASMDNLEIAYNKARRHKTHTSAVHDFDARARFHLVMLRRELLDRTYRPKPLAAFILRDLGTARVFISNAQ